MIFKHFFTSRNKPSRVYLDYASSTPIDQKMLDRFPKIANPIAGANPSALHQEGVAARSAIENARMVVAQGITAHTDEIIFTSGATESNNVALFGCVKAWESKGIKPDEIAVFVGEYEHASIGECVSVLKSHGVQVFTLPTIPLCNPKEIIVPSGIKALLVSFMYVNNEIGAVLPIKDIAKRVRKLRKEYQDIEIVLHTDATQAPLYFSLGVPQLGIDMMTLGATKLYCPKGVGMLYIRRGIDIKPIIYGGGQEYGMRPGTESLSLVHAFAYAFAYAQQHCHESYEQMKALQKYFETSIQQVIPDIHITANETNRTPHISHTVIEGFDSELLVIELDARGISVSSKSACKNDLPVQGREKEESNIVRALYGQNSGAVRFSFGRWTTKDELDRAVIALKSVLYKYRT